MTTVRVQCRLQRDGSLPEDDVVNVFHFGDVADPGEAAGTLISNQVRAFYANVETYLSALLSGPLELKMYDLADPEPRSPFFEDGGVIIPGAAASFPAEVAICLTMQAQPLSGTPQARRRGRVYIGPVGNTAVGAQVGGDMTILSGARDDLSAALASLVVIGDPGDGILSVYSRADHLGGATLEDATHPVHDGWIDDRFDTQRRRGGATLSRTLWSTE